MAYIRIIEQEEATGLLARLYETAMARAGKLFNVVKIQSQRPKALRASIALYTTVMFGQSELSRAERELLAVVVSQVNDCHYWVRAHADDLRAEVADDALADAIAEDWRQAPLDRISARATTLCAHAEKLTRSPSSISAGDIALLRQAGCSDAGIEDLTQVVALFAYFNRIADGLGIDPEPDW